MRRSSTTWILLVMTALLSVAAAQGAIANPVHRVGTPAARSATAAKTTLHHRHHARVHARHPASLTATRVPTSHHPAPTSAPPVRHHRATMPSVAHRTQAPRSVRAGGQNSAVLGTHLMPYRFEAGDMRASESRALVITGNPVWSGRAPPRAGPSFDPPSRPRRVSPARCPTPFPPSRRLSSFQTPIHFDRARSVTPEPRRLSRRAGAPPLPVLGNPGARPRAARFFVSSRLVFGRLPARRPEGTAAGFFMPSPGETHVP